jgi:hypothetical protein
VVQLLALIILGAFTSVLVGVPLFFEARRAWRLRHRPRKTSAYDRSLVQSGLDVSDGMPKFRYGESGTGKPSSHYEMHRVYI